MACFQLFGGRILWASLHLGTWTCCCWIDICWDGHVNVFAWTHVSKTLKIWLSDGGTEHQKRPTSGVQSSTPPVLTFPTQGSPFSLSCSPKAKESSFKRHLWHRRQEERNPPPSSHLGSDRLQQAALRYIRAGFLKASPNVKWRNELQLIDRCFSLWRDILGSRKGHSLPLSFPSHSFFIDFIF